MSQVIAGRYELHELLGTGGMSSVFRAYDTQLERNVALKILHEHFMSDTEHVERFRREARSVAQLSHPNIVTIIDRGEHNGRQFIVFEYIDGKTLKQMVEEQGPLPVREALTVTLQVARGLAFAHGQGLIHRDVKPQNVLVTGEGQAKVTDFGIARSLDVEGVTQPGTVLGTSDYIAPEQATGQQVGEASDVYSLGVVLYEALTGEVPFQGESFVSVAMRHINEPAPSVLDRRPDAPVRVARIVDRALAKDPSDRLSMRELIGELEASRAELASPDTAATAIQRPALSAPAASRRDGSRAGAAGPRPRRRRVWPLVALALALALAAGIVALVATRGSGDASGKGPGRAIELTAVRSFDPPPGDRKEHDEDLAKATDGDPSTYWPTEEYNDFSALKPGVGIVLDAGRTASPRELVVSTDTPGFTAEIKASDRPDGGFMTVSPSTTVAGTTRFLIEGGTKARYFLVWLTKLVLDSSGQQSAHVNGVRAVS